MALTITLSGGNFGGQQVEIPDDQDASVLIEMTDEAGTWLYNRSLHVETGDSVADFVGMKKQT